MLKRPRENVTRPTLVPAHVDVERFSSFKLCRCLQSARIKTYYGADGINRYYYGCHMMDNNCLECTFFDDPTEGTCANQLRQKINDLQRMSKLATKQWEHIHRLEVKIKMLEASLKIARGDLKTLVLFPQK